LSGPVFSQVWPDKLGRSRTEVVSDLRSRLAYALDFNNTGYEPGTTIFSNNSAAVSPYRTDVIMTARMRFTKSSPEMRNPSQVYPSPYEYRVSEAVDIIRDLALVARPEDLKVTLIPLLHNPKIHEMVFIEAEKQLMALAIKTNDAKLKIAMTGELAYLYNYPWPKIVEGLDEERNNKLRVELGGLLAAAGSPQASPEEVMAKIAHYQNVDRVENVINDIMLLNFFLGTAEGAVKMPSFEPAPMPSSELTISPGSAAAVRLNTGRAAFDGTSALKTYPETNLRPVTNMRPVTNALPEITPGLRPVVKPLAMPTAAAAVPIPAAVPQAGPQDKPLITPHDGEPVYFGEKFKKRIRQLTAEEARRRIASGQPITEEEAGFIRYTEEGREILREAESRGLLKRTPKEPLKGVAGITASAQALRNNAGANAAQDNKPQGSKEPEVITADERKPVWALTDADSKIILYVKFAPPEEREILRKVNELRLEKKYKNIKINIPKLMNMKFENLPKEVQEHIAREYEEIKKASNKDMTYWEPYIMTAVDTKGYVVANPESASSAQGLKERPITQEQWQELVDFFRELNKRGIEHCDLKFNMFFNAAGVLNVVMPGAPDITIIDFSRAGKLAGLGIDMAQLQDIEKALVSKGFKVEGKTDYRQELNLSNRQLVQRTQVSILWIDAGNVVRETTGGAVFYVDGKKVIASTQSPPGKNLRPVVKTYSGRMAEAAYNYDKDGNIIFKAEDEQFLLNGIIPRYPERPLGLQNQTPAPQIRTETKPAARPGSRPQIPPSAANNAPEKPVAVKAVQVDGRAVWELLDENGKTVLFAKFMHPRAVQNLRRLHELKLAEKYKDIDIRVMKLSPVKFNALPKNLREQIAADFEKIRRDPSHPSNRPEMDIYIPVLLEPEDLNGLIEADEMGEARAERMFYGRKITGTQWQHFVDFIKDANINDIEHMDLKNNTYLGINEKGLPIFKLLDFEYAKKWAGQGIDITALKMMETNFTLWGIKENSRETNYNYFEPEAPSAESLRAQAAVKISWYDGNKKLVGVTEGNAVVRNGIPMVISKAGQKYAGCTPLLKNYRKNIEEAVYFEDEDGSIIFMPEDPEYFFENITPLKN